MSHIMPKTGIFWPFSDIFVADNVDLVSVNLT